MSGFCGLGFHTGFTHIHVTAHLADYREVRARPVTYNAARQSQTITVRRRQPGAEPSAKHARLDCVSITPPFWMKVEAGKVLTVRSMVPDLWSTWMGLLNPFLKVKEQKEVAKWEEEQTVCSVLGWYFCVFRYMADCRANPSHICL